MTTSIKIAIAETSPIIRCGLETQLKRLARYKVQIIHLTEDGRRDWQESLDFTSADIFILNPLLCGLSPRQLFTQIGDDVRFVALSYGTTDESLLRSYDAVLNITASVRQIGELFDKLVKQDDAGTPHLSDAQTLTPREREIIVYIVKGMTNKEIASALFLSTHTVITHRRNITKKLQIHSPSGLTIYAIMNKMVELDDIKQRL